MKRIICIFALMSAIASFQARGMGVLSSENEKSGDACDEINLVFIGNSITAGALLGNASEQAPPIVCRALVEKKTGIKTNVFNGGHSGITTFGFMPGRRAYRKVVDAAKGFHANNGGMVYFSIMLGTNDSAMHYHGRCAGKPGYLWKEYANHNRQPYPGGSIMQDSTQLSHMV